MLADFMQMWGTWLVTVGMDRLANMRWIQLAEEVDEMEIDCIVKTTVWRHPSEIIHGNLSEQHYIDGVRRLWSLIEEYEHSIVAIGECGVDLHHAESDKSLHQQQEIFALQCQLALEYGMPVVIHSRAAFDETCVVLDDFPGLSLYFHCRGYGPDQVTHVLERFTDVMIGFCGNVTYPKADDLRASLALVPHDRLLLETDAPYLAAQAIRWEQNQPQYIHYLYQAVAEYLDIDQSALVEMVSSNFLDFYRL